MSSAAQSNVSSSGKAWSCRSRQSGHSQQTQKWSGINIAVMVLGFVMFWPVGLAILGWIMSGRDVRDLPGAIKSVWDHFFGAHPLETRFSSSSDNIVFDEYQQTQYDRIAEIKNEIRERARRFRDFSLNARRRADQEEFDNFMASAPGENGKMS